MANQFDQRRYTQCLPNVLNVNDKDDDAREDEQVGRRDSDTRDVSALVAGDLTKGKDCVHEGRHEQSNRKLAWLVSQNALHDSRRNCPIAS
jgi:hypothetical protein